MGSADRFCCIDPPVPQAVVVQWVNNAHSVMAEDEEVPVVMGTLVPSLGILGLFLMRFHGNITEYNGI